MIMNTLNPEIEFIGVTKVFRSGLFQKKAAVRDLSFAIPEREVVGILGANGSGKSTSLKMLLGFLRPSSGEIRIHGGAPSDHRTRNKIGYLPENPRFQKFLTAEQILAYYGHLLEMGGKELTKRIEFLLSLVGLNNAKKQRVAEFSKGMVQRLAIAQSILHHPKILVFDEPMSGLDPIGRREIRLLISQIKHEMDVTILFSSHILSDVEQLCGAVLLLNQGQLTRHCAVSELLEGEPDNFRLVVKSIPDTIRLQLEPHQEESQDSNHSILNLSGTNELRELLDLLALHGATVVSVTSVRKSLEDSLFLEAKENTDTEVPLL